MLLKKRCFILFLITVSLLGGCKKSSDYFLSYQDRAASVVNDLGIKLSENDFFAKELVILSEEEDGRNPDLVSSKAAFLADVTENKAIYSKNVYEKLYPASLTKLMTALIVLKRGELSDSVTISYNASHIPDAGAKICGFEEGDVITLEALLHCLLIYSGNDAAIAVAEHVGGSEDNFVRLMNEEAGRIGASHSNFENPHGLHEETHYSSAYDLYLIYNELIQYDTFLSIIGQSSYTVSFTGMDGSPKQKTFDTTNLYLSGEKEAPEGITILGGKTGTTYKAGNCLVLLYRNRKEHLYISLILKASDRDSLYSDMMQLFSQTDGGE